MKHARKARSARGRSRSLGVLRTSRLEALERRHALAGDLLVDAVTTDDAPADDAPADEGGAAIEIALFSFGEADFVDESYGAPVEDGELMFATFALPFDDETVYEKSVFDEESDGEKIDDGTSYEVTLFDVGDYVTFRTFDAPTDWEMTSRGGEETLDGEVTLDGETDEAGEPPIRVMYFGGIAESGAVAASWQNAVDPTDVNADGFTSPLDALLIINDLNSTGPRALDAPPAGEAAAAGLVDAPSLFFLDVSGDNYCSPEDANIIITLLNSSGTESLDAGADAATFAPIDTFTRLADPSYWSDESGVDTGESDVEGELTDDASFAGFALRIRPSDEGDTEFFDDVVISDASEKEIWDASLEEVADELSDEEVEAVKFY